MDEWPTPYSTSTVNMVRLLSIITAAASLCVLPGQATILGPVKGPGSCGDDIAPSSNVQLHYGTDGHSLANVSLTMHRPAVLLENIASVVNVVCSDTAVVVEFNNSEAFASAVAHWVPSPSLVLVTNHQGNCDAELERGFFVTDAIEALNSYLILVAWANKTNVNETSGTYITVCSIMISSANMSRGR